MSQKLTLGVYCAIAMLNIACGKTPWSEATNDATPAPGAAAVAAVDTTPAQATTDITLASATAAPEPTPTPTPTPDSVDPEVTPTAVPAPSPSPSPTPEPVKPRVWIGSATQRFISGYDISGNLLSVIDLSRYATAGGVGSLTFLDKDTLLVFLDPGASNERYITVDVETKEVNSGWLLDAAFNNTTVGNTLMRDASTLFASRSAAVEQIIYNLAGNFAMRVTSGWPIVSSVPCPLTTVQYTTLLTAANGDTSLLVLSSGANTRLNVVTAISSVPTCVAGNSYNYTTSYPTNAAYVAIAAVQMPDGKVYVRYQHATTPRIVRYDFDGVTLSNGTDVFSNIAILSNNVGSKELIPYNSTSFLLGDWSNGAIHRIGTDGTYKGIFIRDGYTNSVSTMTIRPE